MLSRRFLCKSEGLIHCQDEREEKGMVLKQETCLAQVQPVVSPGLPGGHCGFGLDHHNTAGHHLLAGGRSRLRSAKDTTPVKRSNARCACIEETCVE